MQLHQLEHLIRAAGTITDRYEFIVVGSQSILGSVERPPRECLMSNEADIYPKDAEELWDKIDGALGEGSQFHDTYGYYAQGVDSTTADQRPHRLLHRRFGPLYVQVRRQP